MTLVALSNIHIGQSQHTRVMKIEIQFKYALEILQTILMCLNNKKRELKIFLIHDFVPAQPRNSIDFIAFSKCRKLDVH